MPNFASGKIRFDDDVLFEPDEWLLDRSHRTAFHRPSRVMFQIGIDEGKDPIGIDDFFAVALHVCDASDVPLPEELEVLGKQALAAYLCHIGVLLDCFEEDDLTDDDIPF